MTRLGKVFTARILPPIEGQTHSGCELLLARQQKAERKPPPSRDTGETKIQCPNLFRGSIFLTKQRTVRFAHSSTAGIARSELNPLENPRLVGADGVLSIQKIKRECQSMPCKQPAVRKVGYICLNSSPEGLYLQGFSLYRRSHENPCPFRVEIHITSPLF